MSLASAQSCRQSRKQGRGPARDRLPGRATLVRGYDHGVILRCTRKLLRLLGTQQAADPGPAPDAEANVLRHDRRKCPLLTHAGTLFTVFEADVRAAELRDTYGLVTGLIGRELAREACPPPPSARWKRRSCSWPEPQTAASLAA